MKKTTIAIVIAALAAAPACTSCGYSSQDNELIGQVKKVEKKTPLICGDYTRADISLGVMHNGVGSLSQEDVWVYVANEGDAQILQQAVKSGELVRATYDKYRVQICLEDHRLTHVEILKDNAESAK